MNTRKHPRTLEEAFGPYTSHDIDEAERMSAYSLAWCIVMSIVSLAALVVIGLTL